ncbi:MAG: carboxypeptidase-like regulatory domain-containing protein [Bryobacteraceae bacterium]
MTRTGRVLALLLALCSLVSPLAAKEKPKEKKKPQLAGAVLAGTVFRDAGFALRGAEVVVTSAGDAKKKAHWTAVSDARGEFFLRLPAGPASYNVVVRAPGFREQQKAVTFAADERYDFSFLLESGGEKK